MYSQEIRWKNKYKNLEKVYENSMMKIITTRYPLSLTRIAVDLRKRLIEDRRRRNLHFLILLIVLKEIKIDKNQEK